MKNAVKFRLKKEDVNESLNEMFFISGKQDLINKLHDRNLYTAFNSVENISIGYSGYNQQTQWIEYAVMFDTPANIIGFVNSEI